MSSILDTLRDMQEKRNYSRQDLDDIADKMEEILTKGDMWECLRPVFETNEFMENLIYIAKETDI